MGVVGGKKEIGHGELVNLVAQIQLYGLSCTANIGKWFITTSIPAPAFAKPPQPPTPSPKGEGGGWAQQGFRFIKKNFSTFISLILLFLINQKNMAYLGQTRDYLLHLDAGDDVFRKAHDLRHPMTDAEKLLWDKIRNRKLQGLKFRRQHPIHYYIADFYCHEKRLIVEVDGGIHLDEAVKKHDENRTAELDRFGIKVIRFTNEQIFEQLEQVLEEIVKIAKPPHPPAPPLAKPPQPPTPSPKGEGGER
jgi:very-short-patch-repair endonuclease